MPPSVLRGSLRTRVHRILLTTARAAVGGLSLIGAGPRRAIAQATPWWPSAGTVILSGGALKGTTRDAFVSKIIALAGGPNAQIVIIPTANPRADTAALRKTFETRGARHVVLLDTRDHTVANSAEFVKALQHANAVFLTGGEPMVLERAYVGTLVAREIAAVLARGGVLAGDSAGATALGCAWLTWLPDPFGKRGDELCTLPRVAVSPHANAARGYVTDTEVLGYLRQHRETIGIDIDENTVLVLRGSKAEVFGDGRAAFLDVARSPGGPWLALRTGQYADVK